MMYSEMLDAFESAATKWVVAVVNDSDVEGHLWDEMMMRFNALRWARGNQKEEVTLDSLSERIDELESSFDEFTRVITDYIVNYGRDYE